MENSTISRRKLFEKGAGIAGAAGLASLAISPAARAGQYSYTPDLSIFGKMRIALPPHWTRGIHFSTQ